MNIIEVQKGIEHEAKEHRDLYRDIQTKLNRMGLGMPISIREFSESIARAHLAEIPDYYTRLAKMEAEAKAPTGRV